MFCAILVMCLVGTRTALAQPDDVVTPVLSFTAGNIAYQIEAFGDHSLRFRMGPNIVEPTVKGLLDDNIGGLGTDVSVDGDNRRIQNGNLVATFDASGAVVVSRVTDGKTFFAGDVPVFSDVPGLEDGLQQARYTLTRNASAQIYGLGEHRRDELAYTNFVHDLVHINTDIQITFYVSTDGYGFLWDLPSLGTVSIVDDEVAFQSNATRVVDFWVTTTATNARLPFREIMSNYVDATGHSPMLPDFAAGFWQSRLRYRNQTEVVDIVEEYISRGLPLKVIVIDFFHWQFLGDWSFDPGCFPDPKQMVQDINDMGVEVMVSTWAHVEEASDNFQTISDNGWFLQHSDGTDVNFQTLDLDCSVYDPTIPEAREFVFQQLRDNYLSNGIRLYWTDADEPENNHISGNLGDISYSIGRDLEVGLAFPRFHHQTFVDGLSDAGQKDFVTLSRSAYVGSQKFGTIVWSGDIMSTFDELKMQIRAAQNVAMSGIPWWTTDIGGFTGGDIRDPVFKELIVRWFQFGCFCPIFRLHGDRIPSTTEGGCGLNSDTRETGAPNEIWSFGDTATPILEDLLKLREQNRDYIMTQLQAAADNGTPVLRPMAFDCDDEECLSPERDLQYMFGPDFLVAPVTDMGVEEQEVYLPTLPDGFEWRYFFDKKLTFKSGSVAIVETPLDEFPLFQRIDLNAGKSSGLNFSAGEIAGMVIGCIAMMAIVMFVCYRFRSRDSMRKATEALLDEEQAKREESRAGESEPAAT